MFKSFVLKLERAAKKDKQSLAFSSWSILSEGNHGLVVHAFKSCINKLMCRWAVLSDGNFLRQQRNNTRTGFSWQYPSFADARLFWLRKRKRWSLPFLFLYKYATIQYRFLRSQLLPTSSSNSCWRNVIHMSITSYQMICTELFSADSAARCVLLCKLWWIGVSIISNISL